MSCSSCAECHRDRGPISGLFASRAWSTDVYGVLLDDLAGKIGDVGQATQTGVGLCLIPI